MEDCGRGPLMVRNRMLEKFKSPVSRMILAARVGCASVAALGASYPAAASATAAPAAVQPAKAASVAQPAKAAAGAQPPAAPTPAASSTVAAGFSLVKSLGGIDEYRLDSHRLTWLLWSERFAPGGIFQVTY